MNRLVFFILVAALLVANVSARPKPKAKARAKLIKAEGYVYPKPAKGYHYDKPETDFPLPSEVIESVADEAIEAEPEIEPETEEESSEEILEDEIPVIEEPAPIPAPTIPAPAVVPQYAYYPQIYCPQPQYQFYAAASPWLATSYSSQYIARATYPQIW
jgi:hypothetical protein